MEHKHESAGNGGMKSRTNIALIVFLVTLAMFPILVFMYVHLARREERDAVAEFGDEYRRYRVRTPAFIPSFGGNRGAAR